MYSINMLFFSLLNCYGLTRPILSKFNMNTLGQNIYCLCFKEKHQNISTSLNVFIIISLPHTVPQSLTLTAFQKRENEFSNFTESFKFGHLRIIIFLSACDYIFSHIRS